MMTPVSAFITFECEEGFERAKVMKKYNVQILGKSPNF